MYILEFLINAGLTFLIIMTGVAVVFGIKNEFITWDYEKEEE